MQKFITMLEEATAKKLVLKAKDTAMDIADSLLYDKKLFDFLKYKYNTTDRGQIKELLADRIAG